MFFVKKLFPQTDFHKGIWWNFLSFVSLGIGGVLLNVLILFFYGVEILGVFNQVYAVYILVSQFAVFGLFASVLKYISVYHEDKKTTDEILSSALFLCIFTATVAISAYYFSIPFISDILDSPLTGRGLYLVVAGLWFFAMNKILLSFLNGKSLMKQYAFFYMFRYLSLPFFLVVFYFAGLGGDFSPLVFTATESILFFFLFFYVLKYFSLVSPSRCFGWFKKHLLFGAKSFLGGSIAEINSRVDVLMLGIFLSDRIVGIYSFAALFAEGLGQITGIFRVNYNPVIARMVSAGEREKLTFLIRDFLKKWFFPSFLVFVFSVVMYYGFSLLFLDKSYSFISWSVFSLLLFGIFIRSGYDVFWELPSQSGFPGWQTVLMSAVFVSNIILNYFLISLLGIYGAALELIASALIGIGMLKLIARKATGVNI
jgi:O-antigen/teichoic acid export membrane protein